MTYLHFLKPLQDVFSFTFTNEYDRNLERFSCVMTQFCFWWNVITPCDGCSLMLVHSDNKFYPYFEPCVSRSLALNRIELPHVPKDISAKHNAGLAHISPFFHFFKSGRSCIFSNLHLMEEVSRITEDIFTKYRSYETLDEEHDKSYAAICNLCFDKASVFDRDRKHVDYRDWRTIRSEIADLSA